ncbi:hypothetical protein BGZ83_004655 [Gryganskiella cystojenkinii]|nr:hypothetical protein BGZ83_004655 [Gryganskiella cystojenkinii]
MAKQGNGAITKTEFRTRNRILFICLVFSVVFFVFAVQVEWVPYLNYSSSSSKSTQAATNRSPAVTTTPKDSTTPSPPLLNTNHDSKEEGDQNSITTTDGQDSELDLNLTTEPSTTIDQKEQQQTQPDRNKDHDPFLTMFPPREPDEGEKFLGYLPHSGFHNQLITLENSLRLAAYLNRTLLLPPLHMSRKREALVWKEPPVLLKQWQDRTRIGTEYCRDKPDPSTLPRKTKEQREKMTEQELKEEKECHFYYSWTVVPWTYFYNIPQILTGTVGVGQQPIRVFDRPNMTMEWLQDRLGIQDPKKDVFFFQDLHRYEYQVVDDSEVDYGVKPVKPLEPEEDLSKLDPNIIKWMGRYSQTVLLTDLQRRPEKVIHFGSLFATDRVEARSQGHKELKSFISKGMDLWNEGIQEATVLAEEQIQDWIKETGRAAPGFLGAHLRTEDLVFEKMAPKNLQRIIAWLGEMVKLDRKYLTGNNKDDVKAEIHFKEEAHKLQLKARAGPVEDDTNNTTTVPELEPEPIKTLPKQQDQAKKGQIRSFLDRCKGSPPESPMVFMATDVHQPREAPLLAHYLDQFPCTMFLSDFEASLAVLHKIQNPTDGIQMQPYMIALMDANLAAKGRVFQGTERSTFSAYIMNHLWPEYHPMGLDEDLSE